MTISCMGGGWCDRREACKHYQSVDRRFPIERLCEPKQHDAYEPVFIAKPWNSMVHLLEEKEAA